MLVFDVFFYYIDFYWFVKLIVVFFVIRYFIWSVKMVVVDFMKMLFKYLFE